MTEKRAAKLCHSKISSALRSLQAAWHIPDITDPATVLDVLQLPGSTRRLCHFIIHIAAVCMTHIQTLHACPVIMIDLQET